MPIHTARHRAELEGEFVVFLVGMRINRFRAVRRWLPVLRSAPWIVREQRGHPDRDQRAGPEGLLGTRFMIGGLRELTIVQYWRSLEALRGYARAGGSDHRAWWRRFDREADESDAVGIWHETYLVRAGEYESVYRHMPEHGLGATEASDLVPATGRRETAAGRLGREADDAPASEEVTG
jgi:hypothetical protein